MTRHISVSHRIPWPEEKVHAVPAVRVLYRSWLPAVKRQMFYCLVSSFFTHYLVARNEVEGHGIAFHYGVSTAAVEMRLKIAGLWEMLAEK